MELVKNSKISKIIKYAFIALIGSIILAISSKIKIPFIYKWLKNKNITDIEMLKTFNCGVGFCLIANKKNINKIKSYFNKKFKPYEIGYISQSKKKLSFVSSLKW